MSPELNRKIVEAGLDRIHISVNGLNGEQYKRNTDRTINFKKYIENIKDLYVDKERLHI